MIKDKANLDIALDSLSQDVTRFNNEAERADKRIGRLISDRIKEVGFSDSNPNHTQDIRDINRLVRRHLIYLYRADDISKRANEFDASMAAESLSEHTRSTIIALVRNAEIIEEMTKVKEYQKRIEADLSTIRNKAEPITTAIKDGYYDIRVDCCPTYWSLIKRFI